MYELDRFFDFLRFERRYSEHTLTSYRNDLNQFLDFMTKSGLTHDLANVERNLIRSFVVSLKEEGYENSSINRKIASIKSFYSFLQRKGISVNNPAKTIFSLKKEKKLPNVISDTHLPEVFNDTIPLSFPELRDKMTIELFFGTGIRLAELVQLKRKDFDSTFNTLKIFGKGKKERIVPIHQNLSKLANHYQSEKKKLGFDQPENTFIVTDNGDNCYRMQVQRIVKKMLGNIPHLEKKSPHTLRHTFATHLLNNQADITSIKELLGHSSLAATQVYTHTDVERLKQVFEKAHPKS